MTDALIERGLGVEMNYVPQREQDDCGVATIAMVADCTYEEAREMLSKEAEGKVADGRGINHCDMEQALRKAGFVAFLSVRETYPNSDRRRDKWPPEPVGWRHVISSECANGYAHFSAMDAWGRVLDPGSPETRCLSEYHLVDEMTVIVRPTQSTGSPGRPVKPAVCGQKPDPIFLAAALRAQAGEKA